MKQGKIRKAMEKNEASRRESVKGIFKKMVADQRAVRSYIKEHGTLEGFDNGAIEFAKPLCSCLQEGIPYRQLNEDTIQAMKEADEGRTIRCNSFEDYLELVKA